MKDRFKVTAQLDNASPRLNGVPIVRLTCSCGWADKTYSRSSEIVARDHLRRTHNQY